MGSRALLAPLLRACLRRDSAELFSETGSSSTSSSSSSGLVDINRRFEPAGMTVLHMLCYAGLSPLFLMVHFNDLDLTIRDKVSGWVGSLVAERVGRRLSW